MKTLLASLNPAGVVGMAPYYLKAYFLKKWAPTSGLDVTIMGYDLDVACLQIGDAICSLAPDVLGFSCYIWNIEKILQICKAVHSYLPKTKIVLGGPEVSARATELVEENDSIDIIVVGEGEVTLSEILDHFSRGCCELPYIKGIVFRDGERILATEPRPVIEDLNEIPSPFLEGIVEFDKLKGYLYGYETFRGCPFSCSFCYWGRMRDVRYFPMERIKKELAIILNSSLERVWLGDAVANLHKKRFKELLRTMIEYDTETIIDFEMVSELLDEETIDLLGQLKDGYVAFGLQSINARALGSINRRWNRKRFETNLRLLRQRTDKIKIYIDLIYGLPGDNLIGYEESIRYAMSLQPQKIQPHPLLLLPGSPLFCDPGRYGLIYDEKAPHCVRESNTFSRSEIEEAAKWTERLFFYFNPAVNTTIIMLSQILGAAPLDLFGRLHAFVCTRLDPAPVSTDIGIARENALALNDSLEEFIREELGSLESSVPYLAPLVDAMAFAGCRTMFYLLRQATATQVCGRSAPSDVVYPILSRHVVVKRFAHDMSALYRGNLLRSPRELLRLKPKGYDVVFNLATHSIYHVSEHVSDLLADCSGNRTLEELVVRLADARNLALGNGVHPTIQATFSDLARRQVVLLSGDRAAP